MICPSGQYIKAKQHTYISRNERWVSLRELTPGELDLNLKKQTKKSTPNKDGIILGTLTPTLGFDAPH